jgi:thiamine-phosphate pyrophosphorylase
MLAVRGRAHGAHVGQDDMEPEVARKLLVRQTLGVSTHDKKQIDAAVAAGADYVGFGPCYPTSTKGYSEGLPAEAIEEAAFSCPVPLFAIGGIDASNLLRLRAFGVRRIAVSSAILKAQDPYAAAARLRAML